jgi:CDP-diacylglycerol--glycerol-3-phosphate 3-phosphatidyltransferase
VEKLGATLLSHVLRQKVQAYLDAIARGLDKIGITPNALTLIGFFAMCGIGVVLAMGWFALGGVLIIASGILDALDGTLARLTNRATKFGAFLDSTTDRFAEGALFFGIMFYYLQNGVTFVAYIIYFALLGSLMVSYARARAEGLGLQMKEGLLTRFERIALLIIGLILTAFWGDAPLWIVLALLAIFANVTAVQRMWLVYQATK